MTLLNVYASNRTGVFANMTLLEFKRRKTVSGYINIQVQEHKLGAKGPAGVDVPPAAVPLFKQYMAHRAGGTQDTDKLFTSETGLPMSVQLVAQVRL